MKTLKLFFATASAALLLAACGDGQTTNQAAVNAGPAPAATAQPTPAATPTPDELTQARSDYGNYCIRCHKENGNGGKFELDEGGAINVPSLRKHGLKDSDEKLAGYIRDGHDDMPSFKDRLSNERINGLVKFIRVEFHGRTAGGATANNNSAAATGSAATNNNAAAGAPSPGR
ncbi:MAG TPA: cytochrome c [Pyrinomonadaceae bacterium]|nr:cytochrome c [Pyrinomonadaceae bacterium]